jgi:hypothetical protein
MKMETPRRLRYIAMPNDYFISFDLKDGFYALSIHPKDREASTLNLDGQLLQLCALPIHPTKGYHTVTQVGEHLGMEMDFKKGIFRAPVKKLRDISMLVKNLLCTATKNKRWVHVKALASLA